ncbi:uncharacterized protein FTOL_06454 [Fusarium torulosum]|uniref:Extracellular membrane protein CFEM domain-containing protein n=1 Tax=Fusarium torulosum TaxID=33205 RepID=A0AAE8M9W5_9HYPO|nr:uncharacterized protein FTOL_06454 [Fusarium torulosum]
MLPSTPSLAAFAVLLSRLSGCRGSNAVPTACFGDITTFPSCDAYQSILAKCNNPLNKDPSCYCNQEMLNAVIGCEGEWRQCDAGDSYDSTFQQIIRNWQQACPLSLLTSITTPSVSGPTGMLDITACETLNLICSQLHQAVTYCTASHTLSADISKCRCQSSILSLVSACEIDGPKLCPADTVTAADSWELQHCNAAASLRGLLTVGV